MKKNIILPVLIIGALLSVVFFACSGSRSMRNTGNENATSVKNMLDSQRFIFVAETVNPLRGRLRYLTSSYDVRVTKDSVISFLPYFGRATSAPIDSRDAGIKFTSTDFTYSVNENKSDRWDVFIRPKDVMATQQLNFTVFANGTATLSVSSTSRDIISFNGRIRKL